MSMHSDRRPAEDLRSRRRRETSLEICLAALTLFEQKGVAGTTVDEIAERAGLSSRTFFRLAGTKEDAVFIDDGRFAEAIDELFGLDAGADAGVNETGSPGSFTDATEMIAQVRALPLRALEDLDADVEARGRFLRVRRLIAHEPALLAAAVRHDQAISDQIVDALVSRAGCDEFVARVTADFAGLEMRLTLDEWARHDDASHTVSLTDIHRSVARELARVATPG